MSIYIAVIKQKQFVFRISGATYICHPAIFLLFFHFLFSSSFKFGKKVGTDSQKRLSWMRQEAFKDLALIWSICLHFTYTCQSLVWRKCLTKDIRAVPFVKNENKIIKTENVRSKSTFSHTRTAVVPIKVMIIIALMSSSECKSFCASSTKNLTWSECCVIM
jgi:hypothetical protein